jgi:serine/threonine protein kinase
VRIADFGYAQYLNECNDGRDKVVCGTPGFIAPEILNGQTYSRKSDIFSVGSIMYSLLTNRYLFRGKTS